MVLIHDENNQLKNQLEASQSTVAVLTTSAQEVSAQEVSDTKSVHTISTGSDAQVVDQTSSGG